MDELNVREVRGYRLIEQIGAGASGVVYRAQQKTVDRDVAIKVVMPSFANRPEFIHSFESEVQRTARLQHVHIVSLFDYWRDPEGAFLVMRLLADSLRQEIKRDAPLPLERVVRIVDHVASALMAAHSQGIIHRDIKPGNILLDTEGNSYISDFGLAKVLSESDDGSSIVRATPAYLAPEQIMSETLTPQSDIYSLGIVLFEMLTGHRPFEGDLATEIIYQHLQKPVPSVRAYRSDLPVGLDVIIQRATQKEPGNRYENANDLAVSLRSLITGEQVVLLEDLQRSSLQIEILNPYKGLRAFQEADSSDFFGREILTERLLDRMAQDHPLSRFLAVIGPSGSGKSSVVKAGVLPSLRRGQLPGSEAWFICEMVPDVHPMYELESSLMGVATHQTDDLRTLLNAGSIGLIQAVHQILPPRAQLLLMIDQFEEAFTMVKDEDERSAFLSLIHAAITQPDSPVRVIVTLRADFMDQPLSYPGYGELIRQRTEFVLPLSPEEIERAIVGPAQGVGLMVDQNLLASVIADVSEEPGALPLLQYALTELFVRRTGLTLTLDAYQDSGGALGALARRAEQLYSSMDEAQQRAIRQLFLRLVNLGEGTSDTRRRINWDEFAALSQTIPAVSDVRDVFVQYRLLTTDRNPLSREPTLEIAHEALIREWKRLSDWLSAGREDIRIQRRLSVAAAEWREASRDKSFLMTGAQIDQIDERVRKSDIAMTEEEQAYLAVSMVEKHNREAREKVRRMQRLETERRARGRMQILVAVMSVAIGLALGVTLFALTQAQVAENAQMTATVGRGLAEEQSNTFATQIVDIHQTATAVMFDVYISGDAER